MKPMMKINYDEWRPLQNVYIARMKGCWDSEFKPSVKEIIDYPWYIMVILSVHFLWQARNLGGFPYSVSHMTGRGHIQINWLKPCTPIECNIEHALFVNVSKVDVQYIAQCNTFHEGQGM